MGSERLNSGENEGLCKLYAKQQLEMVLARLNPATSQNEKNAAIVAYVGWVVQMKNQQFENHSRLPLREARIERKGDAWVVVHRLTHIQVSGKSESEALQQLEEEVDRHCRDWKKHANGVEYLNAAMSTIIDQIWSE